MRSTAVVSSILATEQCDYGNCCRGARIHSDSWGTDSAVYDALAYNVDLFSFLRQDFLPIFAAGNFGYEEIDSTIASPSVSKNCLSVGESLPL